ncbi:toxin-antitoxin system YwqK family antitoxin [Polaribacter gochangensis]|uniref:toxin-antitoxin system YwqK family antitoxin n=1 Tax=Polaribacter gochangensis TaxID=3252903 RepID=UPI003904D6FB
MKTSTLLFVLIVGFLTTTVSAQEAMWFDANWNSTTKEKATYYRPKPKVQKNGFWIVDYYMDGTKQMEGFSLNDDPNNEKFHGLVKYYSVKGILFQEINFKEGKIDGIRKVYFDSGKLKTTTTYLNDKKEGKYYEYYETGELFSKGNFENNLREGSWKTFYKNGKIKEKGNYVNGEKAGTWKVFYKNLNKK